MGGRHPIAGSKHRFMIWERYRKPVDCLSKHLLRFRGGLG